MFFDFSFWSYDTIPFFGNSNMNLILCFPNLLGFFFPFVGILGIWLVVIQLFFGPLVQENSIGCKLKLVTDLGFFYFLF